jgi:hypothetical protein
MIKSYLSLMASLVIVSGCTTYHSAASKGNIKAIDRLHADGEDINELDSSGTTALIHAINHNQKEAAVALLNAGADINRCDDVLKNTPLHHAILVGNVFLVRLLVENRADVSLRNNDGKSSFDIVQNSHNEEIKRLVKSYSKVTEVVKKEVKATELLKNEPEVKVEPIVSVPVIKEKAVPALSEIEASTILKRLMSKHETLAVRSFLNEHPQMITLISDPRQQLRYIGPPAWRIMDIAERISRGVLKEQEIIEHIETSALPYKKFTEDEIRIISHYGISNKIINAMISVTH